MYRRRDGDVVRFNVDTKESKVIVANQLFVRMNLFDCSKYNV